mgnify:FL=1
MNLTLDAYYYYGIKLLTRVNIDNTTEAGIFNNNNGFPVSIKRITLSSDNMQCTLDADNQKSSIELEAIDGLYPDENDDLYNDRAYSHQVFSKYDLQTGDKLF